MPKAWSHSIRACVVAGPIGRVGRYPSSEPVATGNGPNGKRIRCGAEPAWKAVHTQNGMRFDSSTFRKDQSHMEGTGGWSANGFENRRLARVGVRFLCLPPNVTNGRRIGRGPSLPRRRHSRCGSRPPSSAAGRRCLTSSSTPRGGKPTWPRSSVLGRLRPEMERELYGVQAGLLNRAVSQGTGVRDLPSPPPPPIECSTMPD